MKKLILLILLYCFSYESWAQSLLLKERNSENIKDKFKIKAEVYELNNFKFKDSTTFSNQFIKTSKNVSIEHKIDSLNKKVNEIKNLSENDKKTILEYRKKIETLIIALKNDSIKIDSLNKTILFSNTKKILDELIPELDEVQIAIDKEKAFLEEVNSNYKLSKLTFNGETGENIFKKDTLIIKLIDKNLILLEKIENIEKGITELRKRTADLSDFKWENDEVYQLKLKLKKLEFETSINELINKISDLRTYRKENQDFIISKIGEIKPPSKENPIYALPEITNTLGNSVVLPSFNLLAFQDFKEGETYGSIKMFSTSLAEPGKLDKRTLIIPESSIFGIDFNIMIPFSITKKNKENAVRINANFLSKATTAIKNTVDTTSFNFNVFTFKLGYEKILFTNVMSTYFEYNYQKSLTNIAMLENYYGIENNLSKNGLSYFNGGFKFKLKPKLGALGDKNILDFLTFDLGFIITSDKMTFLNDSKDKVIPILKTGIKF